MSFTYLKKLIKEKSQKCNFNTAAIELQEYIFSLNKSDFIPLINQIGTIPENIAHDSTEEKVYTKASDIVLAKCFGELNYNAVVLNDRGNSADVFIESKYHNYSLVADAKAFRLSRTAKNQKDFKVESMVHWRGNNDYSVLCCPYFQYPKNSSQIYGSALNGNVSLFSWEYFNILLTMNIRETEYLNLSKLWNQSREISQTTSVSDRNKCFLEQQNALIKSVSRLSDEKFKSFFTSFKKDIIQRGNNEISYWKNVIDSIKSYPREKAIEELILALKLNQKINSIDKYLQYLEAIK